MAKRQVVIMGQAKSVKPSEFHPAPGAVISVDFETFYASGYSVDELGTWAYCHDPRFAAWAVAVYDGVSSCVCKPADFPWGRIGGLDWVSHNRDFDMGVYWRLNMQLGLFQACAPAAWHCSAAACAFLQYPRDLAGACREVLGREVDKSVRKSSRNVRGADAARGQGTLFEMDLCDDESAYAASDAVNCWDLWSAVGPQWPAHERRLFEMTSAMGQHGLFVDRATVKEKAVELTARREELAAGLPWKPALSAPKFDEACLGMGLTPPKSKAAGDENYMAWAEEHEGTLPAKWAADMAKIRRCGRLAKVLCAMDSRGKPDGRMAYDLKYFGTAPGGWAGGGGLNVQNFNRKEAAGVDIRKCIMAPPGHVLAVADYSQIQARILLHLAGDNVSLQFLVDHPDMDLYEVHARATMGWRPDREGESLDACCERTGAVTRQLAKARTLGLGFQCAAETFIGTARRMAGLKLGITDARKIVREYRESNPKIVHLWKRLEADAA
ncbi:MAG: DNA polymerase, partial [bacterium]